MNQIRLLAGCAYVLSTLLWLIALPSIAAEPAKTIKFEIVAPSSATTLDDALKKNIENHLSGLNREDQLNGFRFKQKIELTTTTALQALGYYQAQVTVTGEGLPSFREIRALVSKNREESINSNALESKDPSAASSATLPTNNSSFALPSEQKEELLNKISWKIVVDSGKAVHLNEIDVKVTGDAKQDEVFQKGINDKLPKKGDQLDQGKYESLKSTMQSLALERGYFNFNFKKTQLEIQPSKQISNYRIEAESGKRYRMGKVTFINSQINADRMRSLLDFKEGDPYLLSNLGELNQTISETSWFKSISVDADLDRAENNYIPINITLAPDDRNHAEFGIGYSTDLGPRIRGTWEKPWINARGHSFKLDAMVSGPEQEVNARYRMPLENVRYNYVDVDFNASRKDQLHNDGITSSKYTSSLTRYWLNKDWGWYTSFWGRWLYEDYSIANESDFANLYLLGAGISRSRSRGGTTPNWGDKQSLRIEHSNTRWGSTISLTQIIGQSSWIRQYDNQRVLLRLNAGTTFLNGIEGLPPSMRFFAGGDSSIRGFAYQDVAPVDSEGKRIGGTYMATSTVEYQYRVWNDIWLATFLDSGDAWNKKDFQMHNGLGVGVRWASPIGPIRLDVAAGFENKEYQDYRIHLTLGPEL